MILSIRLLAVLLLGINCFAADRSDRYAVILQDEPVAAVATVKSKAALVDHSQRIAAAQSSLRSALKQKKVVVIDSVQTLANAVFVHADEAQAQALRQLPGVVRVERMRPVKRLINRAIDLVNGTTAWNTLGGPQNAGSGMKIAILDTGIDQTHPAFQDASLSMPAGFPKCSGAECNYTNSKVIAARSYVQMLVLGDVAEDSRPDDLSPRDRVGHGTAAASVAAGNVHNAPLARFGGVAPKAYLGNYKIFGSPGVNDVTFSDVVVKALEDAYNDGMDVASLSLGFSAVWGPNDRGPVCGKPSGVPCDLFADAIEVAARRMTVVVSAGNDGDVGLRLPTLNSIYSPGTAASAITVGATTNSHVLYSSVRIGNGAPSNLQRIDGIFGSGPSLTAPLTAPVRDVTRLGDDGKACSALGNNNLAGTIALIQRGDCGFAVKINNAQKAGAVGVIIYQVQGSNFLFPGTGTAIDRNTDGDDRLRCRYRSADLYCVQRQRDRNTGSVDCRA